MNDVTRACSGNGGGPDLAVIGAGSAGFSAAITAAEMGAEVVLAGAGTIGGTCVNVGCVPSKTLIRATETLHQAHAAARFAGISGQAKVEDWGAVVGQKDDLVAHLRRAKYVDVLAAYNTITHVEGRVRLTGAGVVIGGKTYRPAKIIIATGSSAFVPPIRGIEGIPYLTSTEALALERLPSSLLVIGAGYMGCELAQMFARAGVRVTILCRSLLLPKGEPEVGEALAGCFRDEGIVVETGVSYGEIRATAEGASLSFANGDGARTATAEWVLLTSGRRPNTDDLGLADAGVELAPGGGIKVDDRMRTTNPDIYAVGDVTGRDMFVYMAAYGARIAAENALGGDGRRYDRTVVPAVAFTDPQAASVGLTEAAARRSGLEVRTSVLPLEHLPRALAARDTRGLVKLVAETGSDRLLGAHILAPEGADSIQTAAFAIRQGMTVRELADTVFPYLTTVEGLKLAAQAFDKDVARLSCCAG